VVKILLPWCHGTRDDSWSFASDEAGVTVRLSPVTVDRRGM
jgi:hypothetical protein